MTNDASDIVNTEAEFFMKSDDMDNEFFNDGLQYRLCGEYPFIMHLLKLARVESDDLEDLAGEIFLEAYRNLAKLRSEDRLRAWLYTITRNRVNRYYRQRKRRGEVSNIRMNEAGEENIFDRIVDEKTVEQLFQDEERSSFVRGILGALEERERTVIMMRFWGDCHYAEIAGFMGLNVNSVKSIYRRALMKLRKKYRDVLAEYLDSE
jgi:RNA polymerase sigma factor (sigma-70 family)